MSALWDAKSETVQVDVAPGLPSHTRDDLERRLVRKLDLCMSVIVLLYALNHVDRANAGSARFEKDLHSHNVLAVRIQTLGYFTLLLLPNCSHDLSPIILGKNLPFSPTQEKWQLLIENTWHYARYHTRDDDSVYAIPALVTATKQIFPGSDNTSVPTEWLTGLAEKVRVVLGELQYTQGAVAHVEIAQATVDAALFSTRDLNDELRHIIMHRNTL